jgi:hypothetical protein
VAARARLEAVTSDMTIVLAFMVLPFDPGMRRVVAATAFHHHRVTRRCRARAFL